MHAAFRLSPCVALLLIPLVAEGAAPSGHYMEARTCQVYTGPCFANGESGLAGKDAVMAWGIQDGEWDGIALAGLHVTVVIRSSDTLGFQGMDEARELQSMIIVDQDATEEQRSALIDFAKSQTGKAADHVRCVESAEIDMSLDDVELTGKLKVGKYVELDTRKARPGDCICSNESAYYPPLVELKGFVPGVTIEGFVNARRLGVRWDIPDSRTAYLGSFAL